MYSLIETLSDLLRIPSISGDRYHCELALEYLLDKGRDFGFSCKYLLNGRLGVIETGEGDEVLGVVTHVDVSNPGSLKEWDQPPFEPTVGGGRLYCRGVVDNKGAAMTALLAMRDISRTSYHYNLPMHKKIRMIIGTEQLSGARDMKEYLFRNSAPDYGFAMDGVFPAGNVIQGSVNVLLSFPLKEKGRMITDIKAGLNRETVPPVCRITLRGGRRFASSGRQVHTADAKPEDNAILNMASALGSLRSRDRSRLKNDTVYQVLRRLDIGFSDSEGLRAEMRHPRTPYKFEDPGRNRFSPTACFIKDGRLYVNINGHYNIVTREAEIIACLEEYFREMDVRIENITSQPPSFVSRSRAYVGEFREAYEHVSGNPMEFRICSYDTYAQVVPNTITFGPVMPGSEDTRNQVNESIAIRDLMFMQTLYERVMSNIVFSPKSFRESDHGSK